MKKVDKICFIVLNILMIVIFFPWLYKCHYISDSYNIMNVGYEYYSINNSLNDGRIVMFIIFKLAEIINLNFNFFVKITLFVSLLISNISVYLLKKNISKQADNWKESCIFWIVSYTIIYNFTYIDNLSYVECIVMSLGLLISVISVDILKKQNRYWILKILLLNIISVFCYQIMPIFFAVLALSIEFIYNKDLKKAINKIIIVFIVIGCVIIINYTFIKIIHNIYNRFDMSMIKSREDTLNLSSLSFYKILYNIMFLIITFKDLILTCNDIFFRYAFIVFFSIYSFIFVYILDKNSSKQYILKFLIITIGGFIISNSFFVLSTYGLNSPRLKSGFGALLGIISLFLITIISDQNQRIKKYIYICIILYYIMNVLNYSYIVFCELEVNKLESELVNEIFSYVDRYEKMTGEKVTKVCLKEDRLKNVYFDELTRNLDVLYNSCACSWSALGTINYYTNRKFIQIEDDIIFPNEEKDYEIIGDVLYIKLHKFD